MGIGNEELDDIINRVDNSPSLSAGVGGVLDGVECDTVREVVAALGQSAAGPMEGG